MTQFMPVFGTAHISTDDQGNKFLCSKVTNKNFLSFARSIAENYDLAFSLEAMREIQKRINTHGAAWVA